jgi:SAM-dependent methyltransferase
VERRSETDTRDREYTERLIRLQRVGWKRWLDVQAPYRFNLRSLKPGFTLEVGCGIGRNLAHLRGDGVGLDHNPYSVAAARDAGLRAFTPDEFKGSEWDRPLAFDALLLSHVAEHMRRAELLALLRAHLPYVRAGGQLILITPQEVGFRSDSTHVEFMDFAFLRAVADELALAPVRDYSFPFPRVFGHVFIYNEFVSVSRKGPSLVPSAS